MFACCFLILLLTVNFLPSSLSILSLVRFSVHGILYQYGFYRIYTNLKNVNSVISRSLAFLRLNDVFIIFCFKIMEGEMRVNGIPIPNLRKFKKVVGFVPQEDTMHRTLTVQEVLTYQANLRLPPGLSKDEISAKVNQVSVLKFTNMGAKF